jgi:putative salt-induced outer membrane protein YdiY
LVLTKAMMRFLLSILIGGFIGLPTIWGQPSIPNYSPPKDLSAGFEPNALLGSEPKVKPPEGSWIEQVRKKPEKIWSGNIELGLAGSTGNTDVLKIRTGLAAKRDHQGNVLTSDFAYVLAEVNGEMRENKALWVLRDELRLQKSRWSALFSEALEFDQFRAFNLRNAMHAGFSYEFVKSERHNAKSRIGAGTSYDRNTATREDRWVPEGMLGGDFEYLLTDRIRIAAFADYFPNVADWGQFRLRLRAAGEFLIAPEFGLVLRTGIQERYDSRPGSGRRNDLDYFTTVLMKY